MPDKLNAQPEVVDEVPTEEGPDEVFEEPLDEVPTQVVPIDHYPPLPLNHPPSQNHYPLLTTTTTTTTTQLPTTMDDVEADRALQQHIPTNTRESHNPKASGKASPPSGKVGGGSGGSGKDHLSNHHLRYHLIRASKNHPLK